MQQQMAAGAATYLGPSNDNLGEHRGAVMPQGAWPVPPQQVAPQYRWLNKYERLFYERVVHSLGFEGPGRSAF